MSTGFRVIPCPRRMYNRVRTNEMCQEIDLPEILSKVGPGCVSHRSEADDHAGCLHRCHYLKVSGSKKLGDRDSNPDTVVQSHVSCRWTISQ